VNCSLALPVIAFDCDRTLHQMLLASHEVACHGFKPEFLTPPLKIPSVCSCCSSLSVQLRKKNMSRMFVFGGEGGG
jgi:hypothetical protein